MTVTLEELKEYIAKQVSELDILELLDITSEELVETFSDAIEARMEYLIQEFELCDEEDYELEQTKRQLLDFQICQMG